MTNMNETSPIPPGPPVDAGREMNPDSRMWAMFCHLAAFAGLVPAVLVIGCVLGPLVVWLLKKNEYPFVDEQGKEAVNFQLTMLLILLALPLTCIGIILVPAVPIVDFIFVVIAAIKADDGYHYRYPYPLIIRFIK
jgi:uncharacterized Tic20 family protein